MVIRKGKHDAGCWYLRFSIWLRPQYEDKNHLHWAKKWAQHKSICWVITVSPYPLESSILSTVLTETRKRTPGKRQNTTESSTSSNAGHTESPTYTRQSTTEPPPLGSKKEKAQNNQDSLRPQVSEVLWVQLYYEDTHRSSEIGVPHINQGSQFEFDDFQGISCLRSGYWQL